MEKSDWTPRDAYHFLVSAVAPRPIAWVTTLGDGVVNAAPFSWYQAVCADPPMVMLALAHRADGSAKDTLRNAQESGEFVVNIATLENEAQMVATSAALAPNESEVEQLGLETAPSVSVAPPRLACSPVHLECKTVETKRLGGAKGTTLIFGEVVHAHAEDGVLDDRGNVDPAKVHFLSRLGGRHYASVNETFQESRPTREP